MEADQISVYSYETARDMMDPADIVLGTTRAPRREFDAGPYDKASFYDALSSPSYGVHSHAHLTSASGPLRSYYEDEDDYRLESWCPPPLPQQQYPSLPPQRLESLREEQKPPSCPNTPKIIQPPSICSKVWFVIKSCLMTASFFLVLFAVFFAYRSYRCDSDRDRRFDLENIRVALNSRLVGQQKAKLEILSALEEFNRSAHAVSVLVLVGWLGSGKTFAASILNEEFPIRDNAHSFSVPLHFANSKSRFDFLDDLSLFIGRSCGHSLIIFDDVDFNQREQVEPIERFIGRLSSARLDTRSNGTLVILTSSAGSDVVLGHAAKNYEDDFETLFRDLEGQLYLNASAKKRIAPFLPLTREEVRQCIEREGVEQRLNLTPNDIDRVIEEVQFFFAEQSEFSRSGCKQIAGKVDRFFGGGKN